MGFWFLEVFGLGERGVEGFRVEVFKYVDLVTLDSRLEPGDPDFEITRPQAGVCV